MGLDYSYISVVKKEQKKCAIDFICSNSIEYDNNCYSIIVENDNEILNYINYRKLNLVEYLVYKIKSIYNKSETSKIGCVYIDINEKINEEFVYIRFTAATSRMSILFLESMNMKNWFVRLSKQTQSVSTFIDKEDYGFELIYFDNNDIHIDYEYEFVKNNSNDNHCKYIREYIREYYLE